VDCGSQEADWASVSHGTYLCVDCAGKHRGLGVHLSFVRSTTMDLWSNEQMRRMQLGGTQQFQVFLKLYPKLCAPPRTMTELSTLYRSRAAAHYRRLLDVRCDGGDVAEIRAPSPDEGHNPVAEHNELSTPPACYGEQGEKDGTRDTDHSVNSFEQQRGMLEAAFQKHKHRMQRLPVSSTDISFQDQLPVLKSEPRHVSHGCSETAAEAELTKRSCDDPNLSQGSPELLGKEEPAVPLDTPQSDEMGDCALQDKPVDEAPAQMPQAVASVASDGAAGGAPGGDLGGSLLLSDQTTTPPAAAQGASTADHGGNESADHLGCVAQTEELAELLQRMMWESHAMSLQKQYSVEDQAC